MVEEMPKFTSKARQQAYDSLLKQRQGRTITKTVYDKKKAQIIAREMKSAAYFEEKRERRAAEGMAKRAATMAARRVEKEKMKFNMTPSHDGKTGFKSYMENQIWDKKFTYPVPQQPSVNEMPAKVADRVAKQIVANVPRSNNRYVVHVNFESPQTDGSVKNVRIIAYNGKYDRVKMMDEIKKALLNEITKYVEGLGEITEQHFIAPVSFSIISIKDSMTGGCSSEVLSLKFNELRLSSPKSKNNNCLIACIHTALGIKSNQVKPDSVRQKLGIKLNTPIHIKDIPKFASEYKCKIRVLNAFGEVLIESGEGQEVNICLYIEKDASGHYALVKGIEGKCPKCRCEYSFKHSISHCVGKQKHWAIQDMKQKKTLKNKMVTMTQFTVGEPEMVFVDFETFINDSRDAVIYAAEWWANGQTNQSYGQESGDDFMKALLTMKNKVVCAYNGSGFDFQFIVNWLMSHGHDVKNMVVANGAILSAQFGNNMKLWDIYRFTSCSLKSACVAFNVPADMAKTEFDHNKIKSWADVETYRNEVEPYLSRDVLSLKYIYDEFRGFCLQKFGCEITQFLTLSAMAYGVWTNSEICKKEFIEIPDKPKYDFIRQAVYGGRTYPMSLAR